MDRDKVVEEVKELIKDAGVSTRKAPSLAKKLVKLFEKELRQDSEVLAKKADSHIYKIKRNKDVTISGKRGVVSSANLPNTDKQ